MSITLYPGIAFSPQAELTDNIGAADTIIPVSDAAAFPDAPNLATIGTDEEGETILYTAKTANALSGCRRGVEGTAKSWQAGEPIGRNFTAKDHADLIAEVREAAKTAEAGGVTFDDGETFQEKYESGELVGPVGKTGAPGKDGPQGPTGKTAYQYAVDGGYTGTEAQFQALLNYIPNKQPKLRGSAGQVVGFGADGGAVAVRGWSNPNLLDNWYFADPVNQKGQAEYSDIGYTIDRWLIADGGKLSLHDSLVFSGQSKNGYDNIRQLVESGKVITGAAYTLSLLYKSDNSDFNLTVKDLGANKIFKDALLPLTNGTTGLVSMQFTALEQQHNFWVGIIRKTMGAKSSIYPIAVKLEPGTQQTLAHQDAAGNWVLNDPPPDKALEMLKCQRYQIAVNASNLGGRTVGTGFATSSSTCFIVCPVPTTLRAKPTSIISGSWKLVYPEIAVSNIEVNNITENAVKLKVTASGLTAGQFYALESVSDGSNIILDANL